jgi:energy-coupling factor transport system permease protein
MVKQIILLQHYPNENLIDRIHPMAKFAALVSLSAVLFISQSIWVHTGIFALCFLLFFLSHHSFIRLQGSRALILTTIFIGVLQIIFNDQGKRIIDLGFIQLTQSGLIHALSASTRFISVILLSYIFILTTEPERFVLSTVELGLPYRFGYTLMTALRMIPMVRAEVKKISHAQITRGVSYSLFPPSSFITNTVRFLKVILISTIKRVNQLVISMEGRSFGLFPRRTFVSKSVYRLVDLIIIAASLALIPISIMWR